ncbi:MAG: CorA family divalent cation transporter, partial [Patescibacteria group bacterium]
FYMSKLKIYYSDLIEKTKDIWIMLENQKDSISALQQTNESLTSFELNDIMKALTLISAIMIPPSFITSLFGVNAKIPYITEPWAFFVIVGVCLLLIVFIINYFKKRKWL